MDGNLEEGTILTCRIRVLNPMGIALTRNHPTLKTMDPPKPGEEAAKSTGFKAMVVQSRGEDEAI